VNPMKVLCFDLDDTICDLTEAETIAKTRIIERLAQQSGINEKEIQRLYDATWEKIKQVYMDMLSDDLGERDIRTIHMAVLLDRLQIDENPSLLAGIHWETMLQNMRIYPDAAETLAKLGEKYELTMITNGATELQREKIRRLGIENSLNEVIVSQELGHHKPSKEIFMEMTRRVGCKPEEITYIGNNYRKDIVGAHEAGWNTIWVNRHEETPDTVIPEHTVKELHELLEFL
jgi:putative hydrolase of the HAD superfamily